MKIFHCNSNIHLFYHLINHRNTNYRHLLKIMPIICPNVILAIDLINFNYPICFRGKENIRIILFSIFLYPYSIIKSAISSAISSTVYVAVFRATLSANDGEKSSTSFLVIPCHIGRRICSPVFAFVMIPSNS